MPLVRFELTRFLAIGDAAGPPEKRTDARLGEASVLPGDVHLEAAPGRGNP